MRNFRQFFSEKYTFFDKIAYPILRKMCFLQQKSDKITRVSLSKTSVIDNSSIVFFVKTRYGEEAQYDGFTSNRHPEESEERRAWISQISNSSR